MSAISFELMVEKDKKDLRRKMEEVRLGLKKKLKCKLCEQEFYIDRLPGSISYKSLLRLRERWGVIVQKPSPSVLYTPVMLCVFCSQFFEISDSSSKKKKKKHKKVLNFRSKRIKPRILFNEEDFKKRR